MECTEGIVFTFSKFKCLGLVYTYQFNSLLCLQKGDIYKSLIDSFEEYR